MNKIIEEGLKSIEYCKTVVMCDTQADQYINVKEARKTATMTFSVLSDFLAEKDIVIYDLCLFISEDGKTVYG